MGKKKPQKTKELSVAIAEASSAGDETREQQSQPQTHQQTQPQIPRKRGRPRKIIEKTEIQEGQEEPVQQPAAGFEGTESLVLKKGRTSEEEEQEQQHGPQQEGSSACTRVSKAEGVSEERQLPKGEPSRSRARRKSKPRKSS